jgi:hypothetical protein
MAAHVPVAFLSNRYQIDGNNPRAVAAESDLEVEDDKFAILSLSKHIQKIVDHRSPHGRIHNLHAVLSLVLVALVCAKAQSISQVVAFAAGQGARRRYNGPRRREKVLRDRRIQPEPSAWLYDIGLTWRGEPTVPCVGRMIAILGTVTATDMTEAMSGWISDLLARCKTRRMVGSVDGKALRATGNRHVLSVFVQELGQVALQAEVVAGKKSELSTFRDALATLLERYPGLWLIVGDAMFADKTLCEMLNGQGRHWMFQIKDNQPNLHEKLDLVFSPIIRGREPDATSEPEKRGAMWSGATCG